MSLATTQYSESRDEWMLKAKAADREVERLQVLLNEVADIATQNLNGITMGRRILNLTNP